MCYRVLLKLELYRVKKKKKTLVKNVSENVEVIIIESEVLSYHLPETKKNHEVSQTG
jgi:hypothetical protein